jgi:uncharacterized tellurite resistance protein B-like protein
MRTYPQNSPHAAARIVALALVADGHLCKAELDQLRLLGAAEQLGLADAELQAVTHAFCEDLLATAQHGWEDACRVDPGTLRALLAEVDEPSLRMAVLALCLSIVQADDHVADGESMVIASMVEQWDLQHALFMTAATAQRLQAAA